MLEDPYVEVALQAPPSPDYIPGLEEPEQAPPLPDYSVEYVPESDLEAHPEEDDAEDPEEDHVDYPADRGDDGDDEEGPHLRRRLSRLRLMSLQPHPAYRMTARISIPAPVPVPAWSDSEVVRLFVMSSPPSSPLSPLSSPPPWIPFPPLPPILSPPSHVSDAPSSGIPPPLPISAHTSSPPLQIPSARRKEDRPKVTLLPRKRLGIALGPGYEVGGSSSVAAARPAGGLREKYGFIATIDRLIRRDPKREVGYGIIDSWDEISKRQLLDGRLNMLFRDRCAHAYIRHLMETEARFSREAWVQSVDVSDLARGEVMSLRTTILGQTTEIRKLHAADHRRQIVTSEMLRARSVEIRGLRTAERTGDSPTRTGDSLTGTCYHTTGTAGTRWSLLSITGSILASKALDCYKKMAPKRTTRSIADQETTNTTSVTNAQLQAMINQGVTVALAARNALKSTNGDDSHNSGTGVRRTERATRECTYTDFLKCQPLHFKGTEGVANLSQWLERMESIFHISNCAVENQVKFATCTLHSVALTWWNTHVKTVGHDAAYASKRKFENTSRSTHNQQQQPNKRQNTGRVYTAASGEKKQYGGSKPLCAKCNYHHDGPCAPKCHKCNKVSHFARDCRSTENTNNANNQRGTGSGQKPTCYECRVQGHFKRECLKLRNNNNHGNQGGRDNAPAKVYAVGHAGTDPETNVVTGTFLLINRYASILFDTGADKSFVSTAFSTQINITPSTLDHCYDVELADGRIIGLNTILRGCTLNLLNHPFNINLMPIKVGSFDAIIGVDWLAKYQAVIACAEKIVRIPGGNETLIIHGDGSNQGNATRLNIISCTKTEKYTMKGFPIFLAHITTKEENLKNSSNSNQEKEGPPQDSDIRQLISKECCIEVCEEQKQNMENTILELVKICRQKELLCMHDNVDDLIESALNSKLLSINSQHLNKKKQEVKNVVEQQTERRNPNVESLQNFRVIHKSSISLNNTSQISLVQAVAPILSTKEPVYSPSMGECEITSEDESECDVPAKDDCSPVFTTFSNPLFNDNDDLDSSD
nr:reverse transcriptase domain-containing protein [Tanacetum cinerariifolium]